MKLVKFEQAYSSPPKENTSIPLIEPILGQYVDLNKRKISKEMCEKWKCQFLSNYLGQPSLAFEYQTRDGALGGYHIKPLDKKCLMMGNLSECDMYGSWLHGDPKGKHLVITEGHEDCIAANIVVGDAGYNFTSLPHGNTSVTNFIKWHYNSLCKYSSIILCFDNDSHGREATEKFIKLFNQIGKVRVCKLP